MFVEKRIKKIELITDCPSRFGTGGEGSCRFGYRYTLESRVFGISFKTEEVAKIGCETRIIAVSSLMRSMKLNGVFSVEAFLKIDPYLRNWEGVANFN